MANVEDQMLQLLENEDLPYADDASAGQKRGSPFAMYARSQKRKLTDEEALAAKDEPLDVTESFNLLKANKSQYDTTTDDMLKEGFNKWKSVGTGVLTGTLAIPSDIISVSSFLADSMKKYSFTAAQLAPALKELDKKIGRKAFDEQITKLGLKSSADDPYQIAGEIFSPTGLLLGLPLKLIKATGLAAPISKVAQSSKQAFIDQTNMLTGKGPTGGNSLELADGPNVTSASEETKKLIDKGDTSTDAVAGVLRGTQTSNDPNIPSLPSAAELANKPTINPTIIGTQTETGRKAEAIYDDLVKQGINDPRVIFKKTGGGYVGSDGRFRFDLDDRDAVLKKNPKDFKFDVDSDGKVLKTKTITLNNLLKYDSVYKEYFEKLKIDGQEFDALKNIKVVLNYGSDTEDALSGGKTLGFYNLNKDYIQLNMNNLVSSTRNAQEQADYTMSTLIHEIQHAVQHRETFKNGTSVLDTKDIIFKNIDDDGSYLLPRGMYKKEIDIPSYAMANSKYNTNSAFAAYEEASLLETAIKENNSDKLINLGDNIIDDIINFTGDRKIEFLRNYEVLLDAKNRLDLYKGEYESLKKIKPTEALLQYANNVFTEDLPFKKIKSAFGFKSDNAFATYVYANLQSGDELISFVNKAYNKARVNIDISDTALVKLEKEQLKRYKQDTALLNYKRDIDNEARRLYRTDYGEMEARLVEQRYERRQELLRDSNLYTNEQITEKMLDDTGAIFKEPDEYGRTEKILGGFNKRNQGGLQLAKGGTTMNMNRQMEMFEDGGLKDEGGSIDPVSGNDVPSGSTQEEVRDDIPAQLSEGEFVFPADVVRFIGLEKLMMMRQEAKSGLQRMEDMGQMGNSDEAIMPDDTPFNIDDLDMEDDTVEMAQGGVINAAYGTFVNDTSNITSTPSQFAGQNLPSQENNPNAQPVSYTVPNYNNVQDGGFSPTYFNQLTPAADNVSTFKDLVGNNYGQYDEMRKYRSESGMVLSIPFKAGQPIYPIPEGYTYIDPEEVVEETPVVQSVAPRTTRVAEQDDGEPGDGGGGAVDLVGDPLSYSGIFSQDALDKTLRGYAGMQLSLGDTYSALARGFKSQVNVNEIVLNTAREQLKSLKSQMFDPNQNLGTLNPNARDAVNKSLNRQTNSVQSLLTNTDADGNTTSVTIETLETRASAIENQAKKAGIDLTELNKKYSRVSRPSVKARDPMAMRNYAKSIALRASILNLAIVEEYQRDKGVYAEGSDDANKIIDLVKANEAKAKENFGDAPDTYTNPATGQQISDPLSDSGYDSQNQSDVDDYSGSIEDAGGSFAGDDPSFNKGGLLGKKKPKPKKMKRGGLASRK